jgi:transcriptional regulator with XRE-family HTH domain
VPQTFVEEFTSTDEGMKAYQQERLLLEAALLIRHILKEKGISKADLAKRIGKSKAYVTQLLDGSVNMTLRTISDVLNALGYSLRLSASPLTLTAHAPESRKPTSMVIVYDCTRSQELVEFDKPTNQSPDRHSGRNPLRIAI